MKKMKIWMNGRLVDSAHAKVSVSDRGFLYGDGVFETMRSYAGVVFRIDAHLNRLTGSLKVMSIKPPYSMKCLKKMIYKSLAANDLKSAYIRITITRGEGRFALDLKDVSRPNTVIVAKEFGEYPDRMYKRGIRAMCVNGTRQNEYSPVTGIKSINYMNHIIARLDAKGHGFDDAILLNTKGDIAEGAASNIFLVKDNALVTPSIGSGILPGITRDVVIGIVRKLKISLKEKTVTYRELINADEVFLTNSLVEMLPVVNIDRRTIGNGSPGAVTRLLALLYQKCVIREVLHRD
jgi:branched-chain amino acid aminotransferase